MGVSPGPRGTRSTGGDAERRLLYRVLETGKLKREEKKQPSEESGEKADGASRG